MRSVRSLLLVALFLMCLGTEAFGQGYYQSYGSSYYYPRYNNSYHGYWRDLGYGFSNRPVYGSSYYSQGYYGNPYPYFAPGGRYQYGGTVVPYGRPYGW